MMRDGMMWRIIRYIHDRVIRRTFHTITKTRPGLQHQSETRHFLYAIRYYDGGKDALFKVGKTCNLEQRLRPYRSLIPDGEWFHTVECRDMHFSEKMLHGLLKQRGYHVQREIFRGKANVIKSLMNLVQQMDRLVVDKGMSARSIDSLTSALAKL